jgi:hypothetical protein
MPPQNAPSWKKLVRKLGPGVEFADKPATIPRTQADRLAAPSPLPKG